MRWRLIAVASCLATSIHAQKLQPEARIDAFGPRPYSVEPGAGLTLPLGYYVRLTAAGGWALPLETTLDGDRWRAELLARALFDPFRQQRWALSIGGGLGYRRSRTYVAAVIDVEGPAIRGMMPAFQVGVSSGPRAGIVLRRAVPGRR